VEVLAWVRTVRAQKTFAFVEARLASRLALRQLTPLRRQLNDGSCLSGLQAVVPSDAAGAQCVADGSLATGCSVSLRGTLVASPGSSKQGAVELSVLSLRVLGSCDAETYPLQKKKHSLEFLRSIAHLRPRTNTLGAVTRVRNCLAFATHEFFQQHGFLCVHTPVVTASDCEGAGEQFQVTTLLGDPHRPLLGGGASAEQAALAAQVADQGEAVRAAKAGGADKEAVAAQVAQLLELKQRLAAAESAAAPGLALTASGAVDYSADFFGKPAYLTVSGQLNAEIFACALRDVYTFGPTFRAENSNTARHLAEFWMVEPELAFANLADDMACAEAYLKHCLTAVLSRCDEDLAFFERSSEGLRERLAAIASPAAPFARISYTQAVAQLQAAVEGGHSFEFPVVWGRDLQSEHERFLCEQLYGSAPVIVYDYPVECKAFYMRANDDGRTVAAMDVLVPRVGELMGGSQREERLEVLEQRMRAVGLDPEAYWWYLDLRRFGSVQHAGFGLGFERLVQYATGLENIRDVIGFPRYPKSAEF
jgi:asparaginyl-tRNA synthetase